MRIAIFTDTFLPQVNGVVQSIVTTANALANRGHTIAVFTINVEKVGQNTKLKELYPSIKIHPFSSFTFPAYKEYQVRIPTIVAPFYEVLQFKPDLIHSHTTFGIGWEAVMSANFLNVPLVGTHHSFYADYLKHVKLDYQAMKTLTRRYMSFYYNRCDAVISPSQALVKELKEYNLKKTVYVISNPVDLALFSTDKPKEFLKKKFNLTKPTIMHWGRLSYVKGIDILMKAFAQVTGEGIAAHLIITGDGPDKEKLEMLAKKLNIEKDVEFTGVLLGRELAERVAASDFFASASATETQGLVFLEAMALGLPVIGVNAGGVPEYVDNEKNGFIVEPGNIKAIAEAIKKLIDNPELRESMGKNARESVKKYDAGIIVEKIEEIYKELIAKN